MFVHFGTNGQTCQLFVLYSSSSAMTPAQSFQKLKAHFELRSRAPSAVLMHTHSCTLMCVCRGPELVWMTGRSLQPILECRARCDVASLRFWCIISHICLIEAAAPSILLVSRAMYRFFQWRIPGRYGAQQAVFYRYKCCLKRIEASPGIQSQKIVGKGHSTLSRPNPGPLPTPTLKNYLLST